MDMRLLILLFLGLVFPTFSFAQFQENLLNQNAHIELSPAAPNPHSDFTASLNNYSLPAQVRNISWTVNNVPLTEFDNQRKITLKSGEGGEPITIKLAASLDNGGVLNLEKVVTPLYLDLIIEPQTRTPAFYTGKGLLSTGSTVNVIAILSGPGGQTIDTDNLTYSFEVNKNVLGGAMKGNNTANFAVPIGKVFILTAIAKDLNGNILARKDLQLQTTAPEINFYEKTALYGFSHRPITTLSLIGASATVVAEPYNLDIKTYNNPGLLEWSVDGKKTFNSDSNPYEITLARPEGSVSGASSINFHIRNLQSVLQGDENKFQIKF